MMTNKNIASKPTLNKNFYYQVFNNPKLSLDAVFIEEKDKQCTYQQADELTASIAQGLRELGLKKGDRIAAQIPKTTLGVLLYLATLRIGAVYLPLNTAYTPSEIEYFLTDAKPALFVCDPAYLTALDVVIKKTKLTNVLTLDSSGGGTLAELINKYKTFKTTEAEICDGIDLACLLYTSGTTGRAKGVMLTHNNLASNATSLMQIWGFKNTDILIHSLPIFHIHGLLVALNVSLFAGSKILLRKKFDVVDIVRLFDRATVLMGVPTFYTRLLGSGLLSKDKMNNMRLFISGSAPLLPQTWTEFEEKTGHKILERYGMTEAGMIASNPLQGERLPGTVGFALPDVTIKIINEYHQSVTDGNIGLVAIQGPNVFKGYWNLPEKTAEEFTDNGYFITGDQGLMNEEGRLSIVGREKDMIISGGYNIYPKEIELLINEIDSVDESAVFGVPHQDFGEGVVATIVAKGANISEEKIQDYIRPKLAGYKRPKKIIFLDELPRNTMGKVQKNKLNEKFSDLFKKS